MAGSPWPMPMEYIASDDTQPFSAGNFKFRGGGISVNNILNHAYKRYGKIIQSWETVNSGLDHLHVSVNRHGTSFDLPSFGMDESYSLIINRGSAKLKSESCWGAMRGLETFSQLIYRAGGKLVIKNLVRINDKPRFPWRGIMLDTGRHYFSVNTIKSLLKAMEYNKFNVFHWHVVDNESFPYQSATCPTLSAAGAVGGIYNQDDVKNIVRCATKRGIRVIPEFDTPGHTLSWGKGKPGLVNIKCDSKTHKEYGVINNKSVDTWRFLRSFFAEFSYVFDDTYFHIGGDEVPGGDIDKNDYFGQLWRIITNSRSNMRAVVWQDVIMDGVSSVPNPVVQVWRDDYKKDIKTLTNLNWDVILSSPWAICGPRFVEDIPIDFDWKQYIVEPCDQVRNEELVKGGEVLVWTEHTLNEGVLNFRLWPRACAVAERLWSSRSVNAVSYDTKFRLREHVHRMDKRGVTSPAMRWIIENDADDI